LPFGVAKFGEYSEKT